MAKEAKRAAAKVPAGHSATKRAKSQGSTVAAQGRASRREKAGKAAVVDKVITGQRRILDRIAAQGEKAISQRREEGLGHWLGGAQRLQRPIRSDFDVIDAGAAGLTKASVDELAAHLGLTRKAMAEDILDVSVKTLERRRPGEKLDKKISSHALEIARVMEHAFEVFEDEERVRLWLNRENRALKGRKPIALFDTLTGINLVNNILTRIEEGVYS